MNKGDADHTLGRYIAKRRNTLALDVRTAAEQAGIDPTYWWKLEAGRYKSPDPRYLRAIAETLDVPLRELYAIVGYDLHTDELPTLTPYLRSKYSTLPPEAVADMEKYFDMLRSYYGIPSDQPVFPKRPATKPVKRAKPSADAKNDVKHPWRGAA